jgi:hypothetical protein
MKQFEFDSRLDTNATIKVPHELAAQLTAGQSVRVVVLVPGTDEETAWADLTAEQFLRGYADSDAIYDQLSEG